jgi:RNA polymerase sigma-70 factor (ECF subfamily)
MEEQDAVARLLSGDIGGLEWLVRRYQTATLRAATLVTRDRALAEDVVQAAFLRAYKRIGQFAPDRPFGPWFLRSVVNAAARAAARQARQVSLDGDADGDAGTPVRQLRDPGPTPEALVDRAETRRAMQEVLDRLSPIERAVIVQRYYLDQREAEMVASLGCPPGTVKRRLHTARRHLRALLRRAGDGPDDRRDRTEGGTTDEHGAEHAPLA